MPYQYFTGDHGVTAAVIDCIAREGIHNVSIDVVARELRRSRSALYQRYRSWRGLLTAVHEQLLDRFNAHVDAWRDEHRLVFDAWWNSLSHDLRSPQGAAFRAVRALVADEGACEFLAIDEVQRMPALVRWLDGALPGQDPVVVAHRLWVLMLASLPFEPRSAPELEFRRLAWEPLVEVRSTDPCEGTGH